MTNGVSAVPYHLQATRSILIAAAVLAAPSALCQSLEIGSGEARRGNVVEIPVHYESEGSDVVAFNLVIKYDPSRFDRPTCTALGVGTCGVNHSIGRVAFIAADFNLVPLESGTYMTVRFPLRAGTERGVTRLGAREIDFVDASAADVEGTIYTGQISIR